MASCTTHLHTHHHTHDHQQDDDIPDHGFHDARRAGLVLNYVFPCRRIKNMVTVWPLFLCSREEAVVDLCVVTDHASASG